MTTIQPTLTPAEAVARTATPRWQPGDRVWATWPSDAPWPDGPGIPMVWVPARVLAPRADGWQVEAEVYGATETVVRAAVELLIREVDQERRAIVRRGPGLLPGKAVYQITYVHDGRVAGRSLAREDEMDAWRADLVAEGYTVEE